MCGKNIETDKLAIDFAKCLVDNAKKILEPKTPKLSLDYPYWISHKPNGYALNDEEGEYCYECAKKKVEELNNKHTDVISIIDGGWGGYESDSPLFCRTCSKMLEYHLLNPEQEIAHFLTAKIDLSCQTQCYEINRVLECFKGNLISHDKLITIIAQRIIKIKNDDKRNYNL